MKKIVGRNPGTTIEDYELFPVYLKMNVREKRE